MIRVIKDRISKARLRTLRPVLLLLFAVTPFALVGVFAQDAPKPSEPVKVSEDSQACLNCHDPVNEGGPAMHIAVLQKSPHKELDCTDCHSSFTPDAPHSKEMLAEKVACGNCHADEDEQFAASVHGTAAKNKADVPTCVTCHQDGTDPHSIAPMQGVTKTERVKICSSCHADAAKMGRNGVDVDAVSSYEASFHGKALLRFDRQDTAICMDCHGFHNVMASSNAKSSVHESNVAKTCGQAGCHVGATQNFANSGFSHLHLRVKEEPILGFTELFFKILTYGVLAMLLLGIAADMRVALFGPKKAGISPVVASFVALGFVSLITAIVMAVMANPAGYYATITSVGFGVLAAISHVATKKNRPKHEKGRLYQRFTVSQRIQHFMTIITFTGLVVTGVPIRYPKNDTLRAFYMAMGGMPTMQLIHRICAVLLIAVWIYHSLELLVRWKKAGFSFDSWTMWPRKRDLTDLIATFKYHLGITKEAPTYDRFQFREKFDYFAVYWGMPIMVISGLILWFPVFFGGKLPDLAIPLAYIAHADEAVLAFLTIATWHFYNTHFKPSSFPMNPVFITGMMSEKEMEEEHGVELARIKAREAAESGVTDTAVEPEPQSEPDTEGEPAEEAPPDKPEP